MSEVSVEAESPAQDLQMDSAKKAQNTEDFQRESEEDAHSFDSTEYVLNNDEVPHGDRAENDSDVQNDNDNAENSDGAQIDDVQSDNENTQNSANAEHDDDVPSTSGNAHSDNAGHKRENCHTVTTDNDTPKKNEDSHTKDSTMDEEVHRSPAAEISVTSNGDQEESHEDVFRDPSYGDLNLSESHISSGSFASMTEGIIASGPYRVSASQPTSPVAPVAPSSAAASRLARPISDSQTEIQKGTMQGQPQSGPVVLADDLKNPAMEKLDLVRKWSINTYKCTRQILSEKLGRGSRTVDLELEGQIEVLRDNKRKYEHVVKLTQTLANQLTQMMQTQRQLGDAFADLGLKSPELHEEFGYNADTQKLLSKNGETLLGAINFFIASVNTLVDKTIEDTMINIKQYETARVEFDAYRTDLEELNLGPRDTTTLPKIEYSQQEFQIHREKYEKMRNDVSIKLKFLEENKVKVLHNQLILFHNAIAAYYAGNQQQLDQTLKQFHIKLKMPGGDTPSWLEEH
ncbi:arfaptin-1 isoform X1 [Salvelinus sp. IW2-2015]|uniref:arfaptin-1 isoform X1 n=1 Tax=Salvelinus sp. IW2-2015 TaxID=2691554 RepID=UPI000CEB0E11|nr:arfaptin-1-like isoform X1 [Salvelinus alpinus]XP_023991472.1 arfaptin-1-like isoform X1 [Salvelinus alpinus]XP_023991473.1 arfaptin-1-like isoform X1 [Salvelinus alpinus]XP_023991474.1 arfaptin-1-like isoform X1 [Salvelinus alpinus]